MKLFGKRKQPETPEPDLIDKTPEESAQPIQTERIVYRKLWKVGLAAAIAAAINNVVVYILGRGLGISLVIPAESGATELAPMPITSVIATSIVMAICATLLLALLGLPFLNRVFPQPIWLFKGISLFFLGFSFGGPLSLPADWRTKAVLSLMHMMAFVVIVSILTTFGREK